MGVRVKFHKGAWWIFIHHDGRRRAKRIGDRDAARRIAQQVRERLAREDLFLPRIDGESLEQYANAWLDAASGNLKASTVRFYRDNLRRHVLPLLGARRLAAVSRSDARDLIASLRKKGLKLNPIKGIARTLSTVLSQAVEDDKIAANPALRMGRYLRRGDEPKRQIEPLTRAEATHLVCVAQRDFPRWSSWILCALRTAMRLGELNALQWGDIDWNGRFILVRRNLVWRSRRIQSGWPARPSSPTPSIAGRARWSASNCPASIFISLPWLTSLNTNSRGRPWGRPRKMRLSPHCAADLWQ